MYLKKLLALALALTLALIGTGVIAYAQSFENTAAPSASVEAESTPAPVETETSNIVLEGAAPTAESEAIEDDPDEPTKDPAQTDEPVQDPASDAENTERPAEEITPKSVVVTASYDMEDLQLGSRITLTATLIGFDGLDYTAVWQCAAADSEGRVIGEWQDAETGALTYAYTLTEDNLLTAWRLCVTVNQ